MNKDLYNINQAIKTSMRGVYSKDWHTFHDCYMEMHELVITSYYNGHISKYAKMYFKRQLWSYRNSYKEVYWLVNDCRERKHKFV